MMCRPKTSLSVKLVANECPSPISAENAGHHLKGQTFYGDFTTMGGVRLTAGVKAGPVPPHPRPGKVLIIPPYRSISVFNRREPRIGSGGEAWRSVVGFVPRVNINLALR